METVEQLTAEIYKNNEEFLPVAESKKPTKRQLRMYEDKWFRATLNGRVLWGNGWIFDMYRPNYRNFERHVDWEHVMCVDDKWPQVYDAIPLRAIAMRRYYDTFQVIFENRPAPILVNKVGYDYFACREGATFHSSSGRRRHLKPIIVLRNGETEGLLMPVFIGDYGIEGLMASLRFYEEARP